MDQANDTATNSMSMLQDSSDMSEAMSNYGAMANSHNQQKDEKKESSELDTALKVGKVALFAL